MKEKAFTAKLICRCYHFNKQKYLKMQTQKDTTINCKLTFRSILASFSVRTGVPLVVGLLRWTNT